MAMMLGRLSVHCMGLEKRMSKVLMMPGIIFFVEAKRDLEMLPPTHCGLELHTASANYQAKIWLQADHVIMDLENEPTETVSLQEGTDGLEVVWKRLLAVTDACIKRLCCDCMTKYVSMRC